MLAVFTSATLVSAVLLFLVEPMVAKMIVPRLGGSPSVWITCMLFFQALLLGGYGYAHLSGRGRRPRAQAMVHGIALALPLIVLPLAVRGDPGDGAGLHPAARVLVMLGASIGLPFLVLSTTGPLLQRWLAGTHHREARDPYFLYAASNAGSLAGLLAYPFVVEPFLTLRAQRLAWSAGYVVFAVLTAACGALVAAGPAPPPAAAPRETTDTPPIARRARWVLLALAPSSVLLGASQYMTADVAPMPLLWIPPLVLYLLTFVLAFSRRLHVPARVAGVLLAVAALAVAAIFPITNLSIPIRLSVHLAAVFATGLSCHARLAEDRPSPEHLTSFYLLTALGGVLGGVLNAVLAPALFVTIAEYPIALVLACLLRLPPGRATRADAKFATMPLAPVLDLAIPAFLLVAAVALRYAAPSVTPLLRFTALGIPTWLLFFRPFGFALSLVAVLVAVWNPPLPGQHLLYAARTYFGIHRVVEVEPPPLQIVYSSGESRKVEVHSYHALGHGTTIHGVQIPDPEMSTIATAYYHRTGPAGQVFEALGDRPALGRVGVIGLGAGTLSAYGKPGRRFVFFEIDPEVARIARDPRCFTFLRDSRSEIEIRIGDGRAEVAKLPDASLGLIVVDAFSSDAIPVHLITREAVELYLRKLEPEGLVLFHLTNDHLDLVSVLDAIAAELSISGLAQNDFSAGLREQLECKLASVWVALARRADSFGPLASDARWEHLPRAAAAGRTSRPWTDDYSNLVGAFRHH